MIHKGLSALLCLCFLCLLLPAGTAQAAAVRDADASTVNQWKQYFDPASGANSTLYAGGVWTDKSVFLKADDAQQALGLSSALSTQDDEHFVAVLSAIASTKSIHGRYAVPTDTVFVLDMSGSMTKDVLDNSNPPEEVNRLESMIPPLNTAIGRLMDLNVENRVSVVLYYGLETNKAGDPLGSSPATSSHVMLPLGRYEPTSNEYLHLDYVYFKDTPTDDKYGEYTLKVVAKKPDGSDVNPDNPNNPDNWKMNFTVENNATYIQNGLLRAWEEVFKNADTVVGQDGDPLQRGRSRMPILVLMSDGAPTSTTTDFTSFENANGGNNRVATSHNAMGFVTQLTASYVRTKMKDQYHNDGNGYQPLIYTLGLGLSAEEQGAKPAYVARQVMDPSSSPVVPTSTGYFQGEPSFDTLWAEYLALKNKQNQTMSVTFQNPSDYDNGVGTSRTITYNAEAVNRHYVNRYFDAPNPNSLSAAFSRIVDEIIIQSMYYPTEVDENQQNHDGYLTFTDRIGEYMEVKDIKGLVLGNTLYTGENFAKQLTEGAMGRPDAPLGLGDDFIRSVRTRLGIDRDTAQKLVDDAWIDGQFAYNASTGEFSNYLTWFADANGKFLGGWTGLNEEVNPTPTAPPDGAAFRIRSYGYLDNITQYGINSNLMYVSVQVRTELNADGTDGDSIVQLKIPAILIPLVKTDIAIHDMGLPNESYTYTYTSSQPLRLLYEVGLKDGINAYTAASIVDSDHPTDADGSYIFHTNQYDLPEIEDLQQAEQVGSPGDPHTNTLSYFTPSRENERYHFNTDTYIYVKNGDRYTPYTDPAAPSGTLYAPYSVYQFQGTGASGSAVRKDIYYPLTAGALAEAVQESSTGRWYVPIHTVRRYTAEAIVAKARGTDISPVDTVFLPVVHAHGSDHHSATVLGNNGYIKMKPQTIEVPVSVQKALNQHGGLSHGLDGFRFQLLDSANNVLETVASDASGSAVFAPLSYDGRHAGNTYTYTVQEVAGNESGMLYSPQEHELNITVSWKSTDQLQVAAVWNNQPGVIKPTFTNNYYSPAAQLQLEALKQIEIEGNVDHGLEDFTFELLDSNGDVLQTAVSDVEGRILFQPIPYGIADAGQTFTYTLREAAGEDDFMEYSEETYTLEVEVSWDKAEPGTLTVNAAWTDLNPGDAQPTFTNTYKLFIPPAGDDTPIGLWAAMALLSLTGALVLISRRKRMN